MDQEQSVLTESHSCIHEQVLDIMVPADQTLPYRSTRQTIGIAFSGLEGLISIIPIYAHFLAVTFGSPNNTFFNQKRGSENIKTICVFKLQIEVTGRNEYGDKYMVCMQLTMWQREHELDNESCITRAGCFQRRTSIVLIGQLLNVFRGDSPDLAFSSTAILETHEFGEQCDEVLSVPLIVTGRRSVRGKNHSKCTNGVRAGVGLVYMCNTNIGLHNKVFINTFKETTKRGNVSFYE